MYRRPAFIALVLGLLSGPAIARDVVIGPWTTAEEFTDVRGFLEANNVQFDVREDAVVEKLGYLVLTEPVGVSEARTLYRLLSEAGVRDYVFINRGIWADRISAGVFTQRATAMARQRYLADLGFEFSVRDRTRTITSSTLVIDSNSVDPAAYESFEAVTGFDLAAALTTSPVTRPDAAVTTPRVSRTQAEPVIEPPTPAAPEPVATKPAPLPQQPEPRVEETPTPPPEPAETRTPAIVTSPAPAPPSRLPFILIGLLAVGAAAAGAWFILRRRPRPEQTQGGPRTVEPRPRAVEAVEPVEVVLGGKVDNAVDAVSTFANRVLAGDNPNAQEVPAYLATIGHGGPDVLDLITDIVELARIESAQVQMDSVNFDPESALAEVVREHQEAAAGAGISLQFDFEPDLPDTVRTDPAKLQRIVSRLLDFAIPHTSAGRVQVHAAHRTEAEVLMVSIKHEFSNPGIDDLSDLFNHRLPRGAANQESRLGLAVSRRLANVLGGDITVQGHDEVTWEVSVLATEVTPRQLMLPHGMSLDELIESEASARESLAATSEAMSQLEAAAEAARNERDAMSARIEDELRQRAALEEESQRIKNEVEAAQADRRALETERDEIRAELAQARALAEDARDESDEELERRLAEETGRLEAEGAAAVAALEARIESEVERQQALAGEAEALRARQAAVESEVDELREQKAALDETLAQRQSEFDAEKARIEAAHREQLAASEIELTAAVARAETLESDLAAARDAQDRLRDAQAAQDAQAEANLEGLRTELATMVQARDQLTREMEELKDTNRAESEAALAEKTGEIEVLSEQLQQAESAFEAQQREASEKLESLANELAGLQAAREETSAQVEAEAARRTALEEQLREVQAENQVLQDTRSSLESELAESSEITEALKAHVDEIESALESARAQVEHRDEAQSQVAQDARENLTTLHRELEEARQLAVDQKEATEAALESANDEISTLNEQLRTAKASASNSDEAQGLREALAFAEEKMREEVERRRRIEQETASNIDSLMDDVNRANQAVKQEAEAHREAEVASREKIAELERALEEANRSLASEEHAQAEMARLSDFAKEATTQLDAAEAKIKKLTGEKKKVEQRIVKQAALLREARAAAEAIETSAPEQQMSIDLAPAAVPKPDPLETTLPMDNPVARQMILRFRERLSDYINQMRADMSGERYLDILVATNWIRKESHKLGFSALKAPIEAMELALRKQDFEHVPDHIEQVAALGARIDLTEVAVKDGSELGVRVDGSDEPLVVPIPANERKAEFLENFVSELGTRLIGLEANWMEMKTDDMSASIRWIERYGSRMELPDVMNANLELKSALENGDPDRVSQKLWNFIELYGRIELRAEEVA